ncbi:MAG: ribbon-helix-helix protein, CopG family [Candidatus Eremiobacteraeota bacterium]|nr:ribbon-helix-helix protein, CopG family [Candidatus Eremiobacteraeota bacterium]
MSQVTIYLPQDLHEKVRDRARELGLSLSAFMANLAREAVQPEPTIDALEELFGSCRGLDVPEDPLPDDIRF